MRRMLAAACNFQTKKQYAKGVRGHMKYASNCDATD